MDVDLTFVDDVPKRFDAIPPKVRPTLWAGSTKRYLGARNAGVISWPDYTSSYENELGLGEHFQGIQRIRQHVILSGGVKTGVRRSQLIVIRMGSQNPSGPWATPRYGFHFKRPCGDDRVIRVVDIDEKNWHAGGIQAVGSIVAIPVYGSAPGSEIRFFDFENPEEPVELADIRLIKPDIAAKAVAMTRLPNDHFIVMVWDDRVLDFHYSHTTDILAGFRKRPVRVHNETVEGTFQPGGGGQSGRGSYQSINFVRDTTGAIYFVAGRNKEKASPTFHGDDILDLYKVWWPDQFGEEVRIQFVKQKKMYCYNQQANFGAGIGIYVDDEQHMFLYSSSHWLHGGNARYNFNEYSYQENCGDAGPSAGESHAGGL
jgi:hypothetical protein